MYNAFVNGKRFSGETKKGVLTGDNIRFLRLWHEIDIHKASFSMKSHDEMVQSGLKWFPVTSGGLKRKWYGNIDTVVNCAEELVSEYKDLKFMELKLYDDYEQKLFPKLEIAYKYIKLHKRNNILVHCAAGMSRSASLVIFYIMKERGF